MKIELAYGKTYMPVEIPDKNVMGVLEPNDVKVELTGEAEVKRALGEPIDSKRLKDIVSPGEKVCIITSDITRPLPSKYVVPHVIDELVAGGVSEDDIFVIFGLGNHRPQTEEEMIYLVGEETYNRVKCYDSDPNDLIQLGVTEMGTPVDITRRVCEADKRVCIGNVEYHYFAGYSGGAKAIMPGVSSHAAIQSNHSRMVLDTARAGLIDGNPVRKDIDDVADFISIDFIVNVVLDEKKNIINAAAGHYISAHRKACAFLDTLYKIEIPERADIVIVSPGGYPKDINVYQAQKALDNAKHAVKKGGIIIWAGACTEGLGEEVFENWMLSADCSQSLVDRIQREFELGGHKAAAIAMVLCDSRIFFVSDFEDEFVESIFLEPKPDIQTALESAFDILGKDAGVIVMPYGGSTLPHAAE
ncbi:MAG: nickel-dependent lactate racemase [Christensenellales bacterium]|jgi:nickel-dependent lactate racemase